MKTSLFEFPSVNVGRVEQGNNMSWVVEYNRNHAQLLHVGTYNYTFHIYINGTVPQPRLLVYKGVMKAVLLARKTKIHYTILYPNIRPGVFVRGNQWAEQRIVFIKGCPCRVIIGYFYNYTLLINGKSLLAHPLRSIIYIHNDPSGWFSIWPKDGDLAYTRNTEIESSYEIKNDLARNYREVLGSIRKGWNNITLLLDVYAINDAIDPVQGIYYITANITRGEITLNIGPGFIAFISYTKSVDQSMLPWIIACSALAAAIPTFIIYKKHDVMS